MKKINQYKKITIIFCLIISLALALSQTDTYAGYSQTHYSSTQTFSQNPTNHWQTTSPSTSGFSSTTSSTYWPQMSTFNANNMQCDGTTTDFLVAIPPAGCTPNVVRSDLLAEQNVPVFCKLSALKINPLIDVSSIRSISFSGEYPEGITGISYHPARESIRNYNTVLSGPFLDNAGYVVITLARQTDERNLPTFLEGQLTARINYDAKHLFGIGQAQYYLDADRDKTPFWNSKGYLELVDIASDSARINLYHKREDAPYQSFTLKEGQNSNMIYFPGYYCSSGFSVKLNKIVAPSDSALLNIEGNQIWVREGSTFLDNQCTVRKINIFSGGSGEIDLTCSGQNIKLKLRKKGAMIHNSVLLDEYEVGDEIISQNQEKYYLLYYGKTPQKNPFIILTKKQPDSLTLSFINNHFTGRDFSTYRTQEFKDSISNDPEGKSRIGELNKDYFFLLKEESIDGITFEKLSEGMDDIDLYNVADDLLKGENIVRELVDYYPTEEKLNNVYWAEETLFQQIYLTGQAGLFTHQKNLIELFQEKYPASDYLDRVLEIKRKQNIYEYSNAHTNILINNDYYNIFLEELKSEKDIDKSATIKIAGRSAQFVREKEEINFDNGKLIIDRIEVNGINLRFIANENEKSEKRFISTNSKATIAAREIEIREIKTRKQAYVSIIPNIQKSFTEADFSFKIGIEKRKIELNPERTVEAIKGLEETIQMWEDLLENLGKVIKVWKATCFATSTILMAETMLSGFSGESLARNNVMNEYKKICDIEIGKGTYTTRTECYNAMSSSINNDVNKMQTAINSVNQELKNAQQGNTQEGIMGTGSIIDESKYVEDLKKQLQWQGTTIDGVEITTQDLKTSTQIRNIMLYQKLGCNVNEETCLNNPSSDAACCHAFNEMNSQLKSAAIQKKANQEGDRINQNIQNILGSGTNPSIQTITSLDVRTFQWSGKTAREFPNIPQELKPDDKIQLINLNGQVYLLKLRDSTLGGTMGVEKAYQLNSQNKWEEFTELRRLGIDKLVFVGGSAELCSNNVIQNPQIRYYESGTNKGLPAIVPFDIENGWYAYIPNSKGTLVSESQQSYTSAGDVNFFWICNAGKNGIIEYTSGDDLCQSFSSNQPGFDSFLSCGLEGRQVTEIYSRARNAITIAANAYGQKGRIDIAGQNMQIGTPLSDTGGVECQDFMSPEKCKLLFNVCDPVICPSSRCDLGGKYPVSDVVQTGIIGSIVLCMPNAREGIIFPVCLTGVHAGIDAFVSILRSQKTCLEENLETGRYVGICDEITAIYTCEFFWRNFGSLLDVVLPSFFQSMFGQTTVRGGGEYLSMQSAWDNLGKSMDFFTGFYAENAMTSFQLRDSQNIGVEICNGFLGTSMPFGFSAENEAFFDAILSPQSPTQFYAHFSETPFSDATTPATSHYKVYYHVYAGNDFGASYNIYLKSPPQSGYYATMPTVNVKTGFAPIGQAVDESLDFTAPSGYKELCVRINNQEHCGFGSISSDFAINYATEKYAQDQATQSQITSQQECLSTSPSTWGLISPNLQSGIEKSIGGKDINLAGITRICATQNPGTGESLQTQNKACESDNDCKKGYYCEKLATSELGNCINQQKTQQASQTRWLDVGYCDDPNMRCWLDTSTLKDQFKAIDAVNQEIYGKESTIEELIKYGEMFDDLKYDYEHARALLTEQQNKISRLTPSQLVQGDTNPEIAQIINKLDEIIGVFSAGIGTSNNKAEALSLKATIYRMIVEQKLKQNSQHTSKGPIIEYEPTTQDDFIQNYTPSPVKPLDQPTQEFFEIRQIDNKKHISIGQITSPYYINERNLILKEQQGTDNIIGRITQENQVIINNDKEVIIANRQLGDLDGLSYTDEQGFFITD